MSSKFICSFWGTSGGKNSGVDVDALRTIGIRPSCEQERLQQNLEYDLGRFRIKIAPVSAHNQAVALIPGQ